MSRNIIFLLLYRRHKTFISYLLLFNDLQNSMTYGKSAEDIKYEFYSCVQLACNTIFAPIGKRAETPVDFHANCPLFYSIFTRIGRY
jgi:hypothetical protein